MKLTPYKSFCCIDKKMPCILKIKCSIKPFLKYINLHYLVYRGSLGGSYFNNRSLFLPNNSCHNISSNIKLPATYATCVTFKLCDAASQKIIFLIIH